MNEITVFKGFDANILVLKETFAQKEYNLDTAAGSKECMKDYKLCRKLWQRVDKMRLAESKKYRDLVDAVNAEGKGYLSKIEEVYKPLKDKLDAQEARWEAARVAKEEAAKAKADKEERDRLAALEAREEEVAALHAKLEAEQAEAKAARDLFEAEKQAEANKAAAVEDAKLQAAQDAIDAAKKAEQDKEDAVMAERKKAHDEKNDRIAAELAEKNRLAEIDRVRIADFEHRKEFNNLAFDAIVAITSDTAISMELVKAIVKDEIPNVTLNY